MAVSVSEEEEEDLDEWEEVEVDAGAAVQSDAVQPVCAQIALSDALARTHSRACMPGVASERTGIRTHLTEQERPASQSRR